MHSRFRAGLSVCKFMYIKIDKGFAWTLRIKDYRILHIKFRGCHSVTHQDYAKTTAFLIHCSSSLEVIEWLSSESCWSHLLLELKDLIFKNIWQSELFIFYSLYICGEHCLLISQSHSTVFLSSGLLTEKLLCWTRKSEGAQTKNHLVFFFLDWQLNLKKKHSEL